MRTFFLFALTLAATVALTDDASAIGKRRHRGNDCGCGGYVTTGVAYANPGCCGQTGVAYSGGYYNGGYYSQGGVYGSPYGMYGNRYGSYYYPNTMYQGGVIQSGYYTPGVYGNGVVPAGGYIDPRVGGTIDPKTGLPITPRTVPNPMPDRDKSIPDRDK
jgi:hypothetical protein